MSTYNIKTLEAPAKPRSPRLRGIGAATYTSGAGGIEFITKQMVENVLTGDITSHEHSRYLEAAKFNELFEKVDVNGTPWIKAKLSLYTEGALSALGVGDAPSGGGSGMSYDRLDSWDAYSEGSGAVLSADLGYELKNSISQLDASQYLTGVTLNSSPLSVTNGVVSFNAATSIGCADNSHLVAGSLSAGNIPLSVADGFSIPSSSSQERWNIAAEIINDMFEKVEHNGTWWIKAKYSLYTEGALSALGVGAAPSGGTGGGMSYDRLDRWEDYVEGSGAVLSAKLGYGLKESISQLAASQYTHPPYSAITKTSTGGFLNAISVDALGHVISVGQRALQASDIPDLSSKYAAAGHDHDGTYIKAVKSIKFNDGVAQSVAGTGNININAATLLTSNATGLVGSSVDTAGKLYLSFDSGYSLPTTAKQQGWDDAKAKLDDLFEKETVNGATWIKAKYNLYSVGAVSALGSGTAPLGSGGGGGASYDRLDRWADYSEGSGAVLSAKLGYGLYGTLQSLKDTVIPDINQSYSSLGQRVSNIEADYLKGLALQNYYTKTQADGLYAAKSHTHSYLPLVGADLVATGAQSGGYSSLKRTAGFTDTNTRKVSSLSLELGPDGLLYRRTIGQKKQGNSAWGNFDARSLILDEGTFTEYFEAHFGDYDLDLSSYLSGYATQQWVGQQGYLTSITKQMVENVLTGNISSHTHSQYLTSTSLNGYATQTWVSQQGYLTSHQSLANYATMQWVGQQLGGYVTSAAYVSFVESAAATYLSKTDAADLYQPKGTYLTSHQDLSAYLTKNEAGNTYLKLSGGTLTGNITMPLGIINTTAMPISAGKVSGLVAGTMRLYKDGIAISNPATPNDLGWIRVTGTGESDTILEIATGDDGGAGETIVFRGYNTSNAISYQVTVPKVTGTICLESIADSKISTALSNYLPLSGGTLTGDIMFGQASSMDRTGIQSRFPSHFYRNTYSEAGDVYDHYYNNATTATNSTAHLRVKSGSGFKELVFSGNGGFAWDGNAVLHAGNYSSYVTKAYVDSLGLNNGNISASRLYHKNDNNGWPTYLLIADVTDYSLEGNGSTKAGFEGLIFIDRGRENQTNISAVIRVVATQAYRDVVLQTDNDWALPCRVTYNGRTYIALQLRSSGHAGYMIGRFWRAMQTFTQLNSTAADGSLSGLTITHNSSGMPHYGNASTATALQTARTIWGQSFNGTGNVSGDLSSVGSITPIATLAYNIGTTSIEFKNAYIRGIYCRHIDGTTSGGIDGNLYINYGVSNNSKAKTFILGGNVGIGTTSPAYKLDVNGTISAGAPGEGNELLRFNSERPWVFMQESAGGFTNLALKSTVDSKSFIIRASGGQQIARFFSADDSSSVTLGNNNLYCTYSGNVGIGTTSPAYKLDVNGDAYVRGKLTCGNGLDISGAPLKVANTLYIYNPNHANAYGIGLYNADPTAAGIAHRKTADYGTHGSVTGIDATYFMVSGATGPQVDQPVASKGWVFRTKQEYPGASSNIDYANVASISGDGVLTVNKYIKPATGFNQTNTPLTGGIVISDYCRIEQGTTWQAMGAVNASSSRTMFYSGNQHVWTKRSAGWADPLASLSSNGVFWAKTGIYSDGYVSALGTASTSDRRLKTDIKPWSVGVEQVAALPSVAFRWAKDGKEDVGSIAQDLALALPLCVREDANGYLGIDYGKAALLSVIATAKRTLSNEERIAKLEARIEVLENELRQYNG